MRVTDETDLSLLQLCNKCGRLRPLTEFRARKKQNGLIYRNSPCRQCENLAGAFRYTKNRVNILKRNADNYQKTKDHRAELKAKRQRAKKLEQFTNYLSMKGR